MQSALCYNINIQALTCLCRVVTISAALVQEPEMQLMLRVVQRQHAESDSVLQYLCSSSAGLEILHTLKQRQHFLCVTTSI